MIIKDLTPEEINQIKSQRKVRRTLAKNSHYWFFSIYLPHYIQYPFAPFHSQMFDMTEREEELLSVLVAFRGSGKSTLMTLSYPIWSIVGIQKKKFILIVSQTQNQARSHLANIKKELERNELLKADIGPFEEESDEWGANSIVLSNYDARITAASMEQSIRGIRHGQYRPDIIICDDIEDLQSVKTKEGRDRTFNWLNSEILLVGDRQTKTIIVGNLLHEDSVIMRLKKRIEAESFTGSFFAFPLHDDKNQPLWPGKFKDAKDIEVLKKSIASETVYVREYLLKIISDRDRIVHPEWIKYYDTIPQEEEPHFRYVATGIDLAISQKETADYTAMVSARVYGANESLKIYILPHPVNKRLTFPETYDTAKALSKNLGNGYYTKLFIEEVGYQQSLVQYLINNNVPAEGVKVQGQDKQARLSLVTHLIQQGKILFPQKGSEELIMQLTGFGVEKHDDLADAFSLLILKIIGNDSPGPRITMLSMGNPFIKGISEVIGSHPINLDMKF